MMVSNLSFAGRRMAARTGVLLTPSFWAIAQKVTDEIEK